MGPDREEPNIEHERTTARSDGPPKRGDASEAKSRSGMDVIRELLRTWGPAILAVIVIRTFIFEPYRIPSGSMVPTLLIGDHVLVSKYSYGIWVPWTKMELVDIGDPQRGDIIVFRYPRNPRLTYIKRVVGIPGDTIKVRGNRITINGVPQPVEASGSFDFVDVQCNNNPSQAYTETVGGVSHTMLTNGGVGGRLANMNEITVPPANVFVMGDNRDHSEDSREWGFVRYDQIKGKAHFVWFSLNSCEGQWGKVRGGRWFKGLYR